ncbi:TIGR01777 family oxidoreductase [Neptuniibacter sp. CAU 1671]|uniref:TIGR01777 family oxidoreductase n=1 Tax=Neptuniibacter sp. CAU 1671 TaxID=3032593 RepID=UPI0023D97B05|nr:TIGR01777 family oxidoreductase [Neptuniibacter sp. CAU 1671]MDF2182745.1 TIGR01777 family oxidoreductase [Neptuniibacter sp. CAU 1671]
MHILVTGGTGFIGRHFIQLRLAEGDRVTCLTRNPARAKQLFQNRVVAIRTLDDVSEPVEAVINLAGAPIADRRWSAARKQLLRESRIGLTAELVHWISQQASPPSVLISGSAIGFYGSQLLDTPLAETGDFQPGFTHQLCADWEEAALQAETCGVRVCLIRTGVVMGNGGALSKMLPAFRFGLGGPIGSGQQWMSWIALEDHLRAINHLLTHPDASGAYNLTAPHAVRNSEFAQILGSVLHRPALLRMPPFVIKLMLGEGAELLLEGQRVYPQRLLDAGFQFHHPTLETALKQVLD